MIQWLHSFQEMAKFQYRNLMFFFFQRSNNNFCFYQCEGIPGGPSGGQKPKLFGYNVVFEPGASQDDVLQYSGIKRIIEMAIEGFSKYTYMNKIQINQ